MLTILLVTGVLASGTRGLQAADPRILEFMRSINAKGHEVFFKVPLPSALPFIFAGFKIAAALREYLAREGREVALPVTYAQLREFTAATLMPMRAWDDTRNAQPTPEVSRVRQSVVSENPCRRAAFTRS